MAVAPIPKPVKPTPKPVQPIPFPVPAYTDDLIKRGEALIGNGQIIEARPLFQKAAEAGDSEGALRLAATFDPEFIERTGLKDIKPDQAEAEFWYDMSRKMAPRLVPSVGLEPTASASEARRSTPLSYEGENR